MMYKTMCTECGQMTPANEAPVLGYYNDIIKEWSSSLCKESMSESWTQNQTLPKQAKETLPCPPLPLQEHF